MKETLEQLLEHKITVEFSHHSPNKCVRTLLAPGARGMAVS